jgi:tetratricopeptide (TPR) repeat protein
MSASTDEIQRIELPRRGGARDLPESPWYRRIDAGAVAAWLIPFGLVVYLGMDRGGFGAVTYSRIGIAAWFLVGIGLVAGALPTARVGRQAWIGLALLAAFAAWTAVGVSWSESSGRSVIEVSRALVYVGILAVALLIGGRDRLRLTLGAIGAGVAVIAVVALLSRLEPSWFPENELPDVLQGVQSRLAYPIGYWNALAGLIAIGLPLVLWAVFSARLVVMRALAAAAVPAMVLALYYTFSRGGVVASALSVLLLLVLWERRLTLLAPLAILGGGCAVVLWQAGRRPSLADGLTTATAGEQGEAMLVVVLGVGLIAAALIAAHAVLARRRTIPPAPAVPRRWAIGATAAVAVIALAGFIVADGPDRVADGFEDFKEPVGLSDSSSRLESVAGNGRWQYWSAAADAGSENVLTGIGPGTFVFYWAQNRDINNGFVRDAHSLFVETYGELGIPGLVLIAAFILFVLVLAVARCLRTAGRRRLELAAAGAATIGFAVAAGVDWLWEIAVVPVAFLFIAAAILRDDPEEPAESRGLIWPWPAGVAALLVSGVAIVAIAVPMLSGIHLTESQEAGAAGDYDEALAEAEKARDLMPYAAAPRVQLALAYESQGELKKAASAALAATERESTNWETFYVLARIQGQRNGKRGSAVRALRRAQELDPFNPQLNSKALLGGG